VKVPVVETMSLDDYNEMMIVVAHTIGAMEAHVLFHPGHDDIVLLQSWGEQFDALAAPMPEALRGIPSGSWQPYARWVVKTGASLFSRLPGPDTSISLEEAMGRFRWFVFKYPTMSMAGNLEVSLQFASHLRSNWNGYLDDLRDKHPAGAASSRGPRVPWGTSPAAGAGRGGGHQGPHGGGGASGGSRTEAWRAGWRCPVLLAVRADGVLPVWRQVQVRGWDAGPSGGAASPTHDGRRIDAAGPWAWLGAAYRVVARSCTRGCVDMFEL
jgi:hypothetical protein